MRLYSAFYLPDRRMVGEKAPKCFRKTLTDIFEENIDKVYSFCKK